MGAPFGSTELLSVTQSLSQSGVANADFKSLEQKPQHSSILRKNEELLKDLMGLEVAIWRTNSIVHNQDAAITGSDGDCPGDPLRTLQGLKIDAVEVLKNLNGSYDRVKARFQDLIGHSSQSSASDGCEARSNSNPEIALAQGGKAPNPAGRRAEFRCGPLYQMTPEKAVTWFEEQFGGKEECADWDWKLKAQFVADNYERMRAKVCPLDHYQDESAALYVGLGNGMEENLALALENIRDGIGYLETWRAAARAVE
jgi:hypothetical protein